MAYEANRDKDAEKMRNDANNANNISNAADVAIATKNPYAAAAGTAVKGLDAVTGGKSTEALGKAMTRANQVAPGGKALQNASNKLSESGISDAARKAASFKNGKDNLSEKLANRQGSNVNPNLHSNGIDANQTADQNNNKKNNNYDANDDGEKQSKGKGSFVISKPVKIAVILLLPLFLFILFFMLLFGFVAGIFSNFEDALGINQVENPDSNNSFFNISNSEQKAFYERVNNIKLNYQAQGKFVDSLKIVSMFHVLKENGASLDYDKMTDSVIMEFADSMFDGNEYNEETFKNNLMNSIIPKYIPNSTLSQRKEITNKILEYVDKYKNWIGNEDSSTSSCSSGSCTYDIKGFYIKGKGNVSKNIQVKDLYVRLMQCGTANGHNYGGTFGKPMPNEELVPFEKYILGVAYQEIGPTAPAEAIKAQMVAARSYILARPTDMKGWRTLKKESNGKWVLQVASCTQDQVYCDPDKGCSAKNGQWGQVYSGPGHGSFQRGPMAENSPLRTYAQQTNGEVLVNSQGYIIYSGYVQTEQNKFTSLAKKGLTYKQILLQVYNQGNRNYGAKGIQKASCGTTSNCVTNGEYASWKQYTGPWINTTMGSSGKNIRQIGCLVTSVSMLIAKSGVSTNIKNFNPGTFVEFLNGHGGFISGGNFVWGAASQVAPSFHYQGQIALSGLSKEQKLKQIKETVNQNGVYAVAEVKGNTGQHWVAIDSVNGNTIRMMDPGSTSIDMWSEYNWNNTSKIAYYRVG